MDLYNAMKQSRKYYAEKNYENALEILQQCFDFAKQEYEKGDKSGLDFLLNGDPYDKKLDYQKALRINREAYSLCEHILDWYNREINKFLKQVGDYIDDSYLKREFWFAYHNFKTDYNDWMKQIIEESKKAEQEFKFLLQRKDEED